MPTDDTESADEPPAYAVELGRRLRAKREQLGWSLEKLGYRSRVHWTYVGQIERGASANPTLLILLRLAYAMGIDLAELVRDLPPPPAGKDPFAD